MKETGALLFDGASRKKALIWLSQHYPEHSLNPLLQGTEFEALRDVGPILLDADEGSPLHIGWSQGAPELKHSLWLKTSASQSELYASLQRRLRVFSPDRREFWLRLADARPMLNAWHAHAQWPNGFWYGVCEVWLYGQSGPFKVWENHTTHYDCTTATQGISAQIMLDWPLLEALAQSEPTSQEATP